MGLWSLERWYKIVSMRKEVLRIIVGIYAVDDL